MVIVVFQSAFYAEMHENDIFFIFKKLFLRPVHQNDPKHTKKNSFLAKTKLNFYEARFVQCF